jgi:catechol-2,3-dioxygenase
MARRIRGCGDHCDAAMMGNHDGLCDNKASGIRAREDIMASPKKLSHLVLQTNRREQMRDWYCTVLGAEVLFQNRFICFISYDDEHHRVAFIDPGPLTDKKPAEGKTARAGGEVGLHHVAFTFGGLDELTEHYLELKEQGIQPHRCVNHGMTMSMYYYDPDHNQVELLIDNFATAIEGQNYMRSRKESDKNPVGIDFDPEELVKQVRDGLRIEELADINA